MHTKTSISGLDLYLFSLSLTYIRTHTPPKTEESEDDAVDSDFDVSEEDELREGEGEEEPKRKRRQWIRPVRSQVVSQLTIILYKQGFVWGWEGCPRPSLQKFEVYIHV